MKGSFLWRHRVVLASGLLLLFSAHLISTGTKPASPVARPDRLLLDFLRPAEIASSKMVNDASGVVKSYFELSKVHRENERLKIELAKAQADKVRLAELELENQRLSEFLELREVLDLKGIAADVIGGDATGLSRTLIIGQGVAAGMRPDLAVLTNDGVVGKTIMASVQAARVLRIDDHNSALDSFDQRTRARGIIAGRIEGGLTMKYVERAQDVKEGDTIVTSGLDGVFPRGLLIGHVAGVEHEGPGLFMNVTVTPAVDFSHLEQVLVLTQQPPRFAESLKN